MTFLRPIDVQKKMKISKTLLYYLINKGLFPKPVKPRHKIAFWEEEEINLIMQAVYLGTDEEKIKELVNQIEKSRNQNFFQINPFFKESR